MDSVTTIFRFFDAIGSFVPGAVLWGLVYASVVRGNAGLESVIGDNVAAYAVGFALVISSGYAVSSLASLPYWWCLKIWSLPSRLPFKKAVDRISQDVKTNTESFKQTDLFKLAADHFAIRNILSTNGRGEDAFFFMAASGRMFAALGVIVASCLVVPPFWSLVVETAGVPWIAVALAAVILLFLAGLEWFYYSQYIRAFHLLRWISTNGDSECKSILSALFRTSPESGGEVSLR